MKAWKFAIVVLVVAVLSIGSATAALAAPGAPEMDACPHEATIAALRQCVTDATKMGHIADAATSMRLRNLLIGAEVAAVRGQTDLAANRLAAFSALVMRASAQGRINAECADHLLEHAELVAGAMLNP